jgi:aminocarboxymuconate-semialdehyde decarboxylase
VLVDHQTHWYPRSAWERLVRREAYPRARAHDGGYRYEPGPGVVQQFGREMFDLGYQLDDLTRHGIDVMVCSPIGVPGIGDVAPLPLGEAEETARSLNEEFSAAQREHRGRFVGLCVLPWQDTATALAVLEDAIGRLALRGVSLPSNLAGEPVVAEQTMPVLRRIAELGVPLVLHPTLQTAMSGAYARYGPALELTSWMFDTSAAALALIAAGVLEENPGLQVIHPHAGGTLPFIAGRIASLDQAFGNGLPRPTLDYLRDGFYVDTVTTTPGALEMAAATYGADRVLLASDYPWVPRAVALDHLRTAVADELARRVLGANTVPGLLPAAA